MNDSFVEHERLPDGERIVSVPLSAFSEVLDCLETAFPDVRRGFFHSIAQRDPWGDEGERLAVERDGRILSFVQVLSRRMNFDSQSIRFGGIGSVGTRPECQGRGYSSALMKFAAEWMASQGMRGGMLFTKIHPFYEKLGWRTVVQFEPVVPIDRLIRHRPAFGRCRTLQERDLPPVKEIYERQMKRLPGGLERNDAYWQTRSSWMNHRAQVLVNESGGIDAYFWSSQYNPNEATLGISEYGLREDSGELFGDLAGAMVERALELNCTRLRGPFKQHGLLYEWLTQNAPPIDDWQNRYVMWRDLNDSGLYEPIVEAAREGRFLYWPTDAF